MCRKLKYFRNTKTFLLQRQKVYLLGPGIEPGSQQCECRVLTAILSKLRC